MKTNIVVTFCVIICLLPKESFSSDYTRYLLNGGVISFGRDINDYGQVVGVTHNYDSSYIISAVLWNSLYSFPSSLDENSRVATAHLINNSGLVIGYHESAPGIIMPYWRSSSGIITITEPFVPAAVAEDGRMVGWKSVTGIQQVPVVVSRIGDSNYQVTYLDYTLNNGGKAYDINEAGYVIGDSYATVGGGHACLWYQGNVVDLGAFGGTWSTAKGINNSGQVVITYGNENGVIANLVWDLTGNITQIPSNPLFDGGLFDVRDINDQGVILGNAQIGGVGKVITWSQSGGFTIVDTGIAYAINNSGWIVGDTDLNEPRAVVWAPVPEPATLVTLACGLAGMAGVLRRKTK